MADAIGGYMAEIWRYYMLLFLICIGLVLPGLSRAEDAAEADLFVGGGTADAWETTIPVATEAQERQIFEGCAFKAELVFSIAQEKLYNGGNTEKMLAYLKSNMSMAEYRIQEQFMRWLGTWVDQHKFESAHEYSASLFNECVANSYQHFQARPSDHADFMMRLFYQQLDATEEKMLPIDTDGEVSA